MSKFILSPYQSAALETMGAAFDNMGREWRKGADAISKATATLHRKEEERKALVAARRRLREGTATYDDRELIADWQMLHGEGSGRPLGIFRAAGIGPAPQLISTDINRTMINKTVVYVMAGGEITQAMIDAIELCARRIKAEARQNLRNVLFTVHMLQTDLPGVVGHSVNEFAIRYWPKPKSAEEVLMDYIAGHTVQEALDAIGDKFGDVFGNEEDGLKGASGYHAGGVVSTDSYGLVGDCGHEVVTLPGKTLH